MAVCGSRAVAPPRSCLDGMVLTCSIFHSRRLHGPLQGVATMRVDPSCVQPRAECSHDCGEVLFVFSVLILVVFSIFFVGHLSADIVFFHLLLDFSSLIV